LSGVIIIVIRLHKYLVAQFVCQTVFKKIIYASIYTNKEIHKLF